MRAHHLLLVAVTLLVACGDAGSDASSILESAIVDAPDADSPDIEAHDAGMTSEIPPTAAAGLDAWLVAKQYASWTCESAAHESRPPSGHSSNRICSNRALSGHGPGEYPVGAASVKELFDDAGNVIGHAVATKVAPGGGESWYWYEKIGDRVIADGLGTSGTPRTVCTRCHNRAGAATFGHDLVFTQVH